MDNTQKPNILFFFTDDQRFDTIHALGNQEIRTPNLDRLVSEGVSFTHAHIPCGTSAAVCMPSRAMLHSGRTLFHLEGAGQRIPENHATIGQTLGQCGYETFGTGKWHNGRESFNRSFSNGSEIFFGGMADHWNVPAYRYDPSGKYDAACPVVDDPGRSNEVRFRECDHITAGKHSSEMVTGAAIDFISQRGKEEPFFAYISFLAPHDPRTMPKEFLDMYDPGSITLPANFMGGHPFDNGSLHIRDEMLADFPRNPEETKRHIAEYYAMISHLDDHLGRVLGVLAENNQLENTIVVFAGDNGLALGRHGLFGKQNCYEHSVRVPLIIAGPGIPKNKRSDAYVYLFDIFPTLCELVGADIPATVEGKSLVPLLHDESSKIRDTLYFAYTDVQRAAKDKRFKLIEYVINGKHTQTQLFDLENDPEELENLAHKQEFSTKLSDLRSELIRYRDSWDDTSSEWGERFWAGYGT